MEIIKRKIFKHNMSCKDCKEPYSDKETLERHLILDNIIENICKTKFEDLELSKCRSDEICLGVTSSKALRGDEQ